MTTDEYAYLVFAFVVLVAIILDLGLLSKRSTEINMRKAFYQTICWILLAFIFFGILLWLKGHTTSMEYISAYIMEWSLSIDNIFVFLLIFSFFNIQPDHVARALLLGILMAIVFRIGFITAGVILVREFSWLLYVFGLFLAYTGIRIFAVKGEKQFDPASNLINRFLNRTLPIIHQDVGGKLIYRKDGKRYFTNMFVLIIVLATTDLLFAIDSIPAVFALSKDRMVIYTSNIFAVLGLRSLFFLLKGAINKFRFLQKGIAIVLIFIGFKMLAEAVHVYIQLYLSLIIIVVCIGGSILISIQFAYRTNKE